MIRIKRALISVSDKTGIVDFAHQLNEFGVEILSTGGTARLLRENNIAVVDVSDYTGFPEMLDGRVKTLHPKIHAGLLALRSNSAHMQTLEKQGIGLIDMVVVNLYPFEKTVAKEGVTSEEAIENIDIGGPSMLRSAAKNHQSVVVVSSPTQYARILEELKQDQGGISSQTAEELSAEVFRLTSHYDVAIYNYLSSKEREEERIQRENIFRQVEDAGFKKYQAWEVIGKKTIDNINRLPISAEKKSEALQKVRDAMAEKTGIVKFVDNCERIYGSYINEYNRNIQKKERI